MQEMKCENFGEFWCYYVRSHHHPETQKIHFQTFLIYIFSWSPLVITFDLRHVVFILMGLANLFIQGTLAHKKFEKYQPPKGYYWWGLKAYLRLLTMTGYKYIRAETKRIYDERKDQFNIVIKQEENFQNEEKRRINRDFVAPESWSYWDIFVLKHQHPQDVIWHILGIWWMLILIVISIYTLQLWLYFVAVFGSLLIGNIGHTFVERSYVDPEDGVISPRVAWALATLFLKFHLGTYWKDVNQVKSKLTYHVKK